MRTKWRAHSCEPRRDSSRRLSSGRNQPSKSQELLAVGIFGSRSRIADRIEMLVRRGRTFSPRVSASGVAVSTVILGALMLAGSLAPRWIAFAQQPAHPSFEVASIQPAPPPAGKSVIFGMKSDPNRFTGSYITLQDLIAKAYGVDHSRISGGPPWAPLTVMTLSRRFHEIPRRNRFRQR
jgi:hypothetical protein